METCLEKHLRTAAFGETKTKKKSSNLDRKFKNNVFQNPEKPSSEEQLSENKAFIPLRRKINDHPITVSSVQSKVSVQNAYVQK